MIRKAKNNDIRAIYALLLEESSRGKVLQRSLKELKKGINNFFVYEEDNNVIGCCSLEIYNKKLAEIRSLVVSFKFRKRGIGSALVEKCLNEAKTKDIYQVLSVTDKNNFFGRFGFNTKVNKKQAMFLYLK